MYIKQSCFTVHIMFYCSYCQISVKNVIFKHCGTNTILTLKLAVIRIIISDVFNGVLFQQLFFHQYYNIQSVLWIYIVMLVQWFKLDTMLYFKNCYRIYLKTYPVIVSAHCCAQLHIPIYLVFRWVH